MQYLTLVILFGILNLGNTNVRADSTGFTDIVNGQTATDGEFPFQLRITVQQRVIATGVVVKNYGYCGGSLVGQTWALTAGHCIWVNSTDPTRITAYYLEAGSVIVGQPRQSAVVYQNNVYLHPNYQRINLVNDLALLKTSPFSLSTPYVKTISIAPSSWYSGMYEWETVTVSGFGYTTTGGTKATRLSWTQLTGISRQYCYDQYGNSIALTSFCAQDLSGIDSSTCPGDSGGPLTFPDYNGTPIQVGIVSSGPQPCNSGAQLFTDVAQFNSWITSVIS
ncbi:hypothetical protein DMENIID0001_062580 [Sergentomyia squamirostris]